MSPTGMETHCYSPLYVDTSYEYDLDAYFPRPSEMSPYSQPTLMVHQKENCPCTEISDLQSLIESCTDLECSESDSFIDDLIEESIDNSRTEQDEKREACCSTKSDSYLEPNDDILTDIIPLEAQFTPDLTTSLRNAEEQTPERISWSNTNNFGKGAKRKLFSCDDGYQTKRFKSEFTCDDQEFYSVLDNLFNYD